MNGRRGLIRYWLVLLLGFMGVLPVQVLADPESELSDRIAQSMRELSAITSKTNAESARLEQALHTREKTISKLRAEAASRQRMADEQLLGLDKLQERLDQWTAQSKYQQHLLASYAGMFFSESGTLTGNKKRDFIQDRTLSAAVEKIASMLDPQWSKRNLITPQGDVKAMTTLMLGPLHVAYDQLTDKGGLVVSNPESGLRILDIYDAATVAELQSLQQSGYGLVNFDPTLGNALKMQNNDDSLLAHLQAGGIWALPILFFGALSLLIAALKGAQFLRLPAIDSRLADRLHHLVTEQRKKYQVTDSVALRHDTMKLADRAGPAQRRLIDIAVSTPVSQQRDDLFVALLMEHKHKLERYMGVVAMSAAVAPLLGLLGTVSGMISTFKMMTIFGSGDPSTVSGGISEALVTTELGLIVAIPSLIVSALLNRKVKSYAHKLETFAVKLSKVKF